MKAQNVKRLQITGPDTVDHSEDGLNIDIRIPITFRRRGGRTLITTPDGQPLTPPTQHPSPALRDALVRAHTWVRRLDSKKAKSLLEISRQENISAKGRASSLIRLIGLSPKIQEAIITGENLGYLTLEDFLKPFPSHWEEQEAHFLTGMKE